MNENIKQIMIEDIRIMKRSAVNSHRKRKKSFVNLYHKGENLKAEMVVYNMEKIIPIEEFKKLDKSMQKTYMESWRKNFKNDEIREGLGVANTTLYEIFNNLDIKKRPVSRKNKSKQEKKSEPVESAANIGIFISLNGDMKSKDLSSRLKNIGNMIGATDGNYSIELKITQK